MVLSSTSDPPTTTIMSCIPRRHVGPTFNHERYSEIEGEANLNFEYDQASLQSETSLGSMVFGLFNISRITDAMKKVVSNGKNLLNRITSRRSNDRTPTESVEKQSKSYIPATEIVTFPSHMVSATTPQDTTSSPSPAHVSPLDQLQPDDPSLHFNNVSPLLRTQLFSVNTKERFEVGRYKERSSSEPSFPEIEKGIVSIRARWLEPILTGKKTDQKMSLSALEMPFSRENSWQVERMILVEKLLLVSEPDKEHEFDDTPRLYKHRMPEDEPEPWVKPGTVARGALWLEPILTGRERPVGFPYGVIPKCENKPTSPTGVVEASFFT